ncbi:hypothetical protein LCGC14_1410110 [marine sediment metagenome]|uniref:Uncharacterized protein n=1 Tax=marine sediment metagenome TaxID=412755 RepID=A0A0F9M9X2_9ZZZZ
MNNTYQIKNLHTQKVISKIYTSRKRANNRMDKLNNEYGAYKYTVVVKYNQEAISCDK